MSENATWPVGDVTVTRVVERDTALGVRDYLPTCDEAGLARNRGWLKPWALNDDDELLFVIQALCVEADGRKILVDTCVGNRQLPEMFQWVANDGTFINALAAAGFGRDDIDLVVCTHLHFDHVGWNTILENGRWVPTFTRARYLLPRVEHEHWIATSAEGRDAGMVYNFGDAVTPLFDAGVVDLVESNHQVSEAIRLVPTPGHSPGHVSVRISSQGEEALITGDCAHHALQFAEPDWYSAADLDPDAAGHTRRRVVAEYADSGVLIIGTHFAPPTAGHLTTVDGSVRFRPLD